MDRPIDPRYEVLEHIGSGGMGEVYRARDRVLDRQVAIKVLPEDLSSDRKRLVRFEREARAAARLSHPNIVAIPDLGSFQGVPFAVMELLEGRDLGGRLKAGALPWREALDIAIRILEGLEAAHSSGVIHRDLKPSNVFLTRGGAVKVLDFGLARVREARRDDMSGQTTLTEHGAAVGTPAYMAPEQVRARPAGPRSDLFAFGYVLVGWRSARTPFTPALEVAANRIAVVPFANPTGNPTLDRIGAFAADRIAQRLAELEPMGAEGFGPGADIVPVADMGTLGARASPPAPATVARQTGARIAW